MLPSGASAMSGFTGEIYFTGFARVWQPIISPETHSYGFSSTNYPGGGYTTVGAAFNGVNGRREGWATNFVRVCDAGVYPNCTDYDGFGSQTYGYSNPDHTLDVHSLY